jgi:uncharacterized protein (DUF58 family)
MMSLPRQNGEDPEPGGEQEPGAPGSGKAPGSGGSFLSGRFLALAGLAYALIFAGFTTLNGLPLALAVPLVIYLGSTLFQRPPSTRLRLERKVSIDTTGQNAPVEVSLRVINEGAGIDEILIADQLPGGVRLLEGRTRVLTSMPKGASLELKYTVTAHRGSYLFDQVLIDASDHLGVLRERKMLSSRQKVIFLPEIARLRKVAIRPLRTHGHFGPIPSRKPGSGIDFYGLREYQMGDPRRWINWRASARHMQELFVNQFEQERIADVGIILDARQQSNIVLPDGQSLFEYSVQATGSLSAALLEDGNRVGLLIYGFGLERTFPGYGKVQQERILFALGQARTGHNWALDSLGYLPTRFFPAGSQIVMVTPLTISDGPALARLRACGYELLVVSPDPVDFESRAFPQLPGVPRRIAHAERSLLLHQLNGMGIRVLDWPVDRPLEPLVRATLSRIRPGRPL